VKARVRIQTAFLLIGGAVFTGLVAHLGLSQIVRNLRATGVWFPAILAAWSVSYSLNTCSFGLILGPDRQKVGFRRIFAIVVAGYAMNYSTPMLQMGGEPFRAVALKPYVGGVRAVSATVSYKLISALSHLCYWLVGLVAVAITLQAPLRITGAAFGVIAMVLAAAVAWLTRHRTGAFQAILGLARRHAWLPVPRQWLARHEATLMSADEYVRDLFQMRPAAFVAALAFELVGRAVASLEFLFILRSVGQRVSPLTSLAIDSASTFFLNVLFFIPFELGSREGGLYLIMRGLSFPAALGIYAALVNRVRELFWVLTGLVLGRFATRGTSASRGPQTV
jgi:uncharacterized protein (TIRG00374 family)